MIQARKVQPKDLDYIFQNAAKLGFDQEQMINKLENMMIVIDNNEICGIGFYINHQNICFLNWIFIKEDKRRNRLGTMLVKTMLNTAEQQGALQAYIPLKCQEFADFLGFQRITELQQAIAANELYNSLYDAKVSGAIAKVSLYDYFKPCCH